MLPGALAGATAPDLPDTLNTSANPAFWTAEVGNLSDAIEQGHRLLKDQPRTLCPDHPTPAKPEATSLTRLHLRCNCIPAVHNGQILASGQGPAEVTGGYDAHEPQARIVAGLQGSRGEQTMAEIVLIHGMAQEQESADSLEARWIPALAGGVRVAGYPALADRISRSRQPADAIEVRMGAYGDLFLTPGAQGSDHDLNDLGAEELALAEALAAEWLNRAAERDRHPDHDTAVLELGYLDPSHETQGIREETARAVLNAATRLRWFATGAMALVERSVNKSLRQVTKYMTDPGLREQIQNRVTPLIGPETKIIIGHSLGSVIAYDLAVSHSGARIPLLLTIGSPLGLRSIIYDRLIPQPPGYPAPVRRWVNIADRNDLVAAEPDLTTLFDRNRPADSTLESAWTVDNGAKPHQGEYYLGKLEAGKPIAETLTAPS
jgi:hypothetical protein